MVVDALDECPVETDTKAKVLCALLKLPNLHLLVTSRPYVDINSEFNKLVQLDIRAANRDMEVFIRGRLDENQNLKRYVDEDFKEALVDKIVNKSKGMCVRLSIFSTNCQVSPRSLASRNAFTATHSKRSP